MQRRATFTRLIGALAVCLACAAPAHAGRDFDDHDLAALLAGGARGVIYLWSPHMPYSVQGARDVHRVAADLGLTAVLLLDPYAEPALTEQVLRAQRLPASAARRVRARALLERGVTQHFPTVVVFERGRLDAQMLPGYTPPRALRAFIRQRLLAF